jgi:hypothetical protein
MTLETTHRGYTIRYSENQDKWWSHDAGDGMEAETLSKLKEKIDRMIAKGKKATAIHFLVIDSDSSLRKTALTEAKMTGYLGPKIVNKTGYSSEKEVRGHSVEAVYVSERWGRRDEKAARRSTGLDNCCPDTPEVHAALAEANRLGLLARQADADYRKAVAAIPRMTLADIDQLVKLSGIDPTGGLEAKP